MLTFEQLEPALHKWAHHFQNRLFDHWELINEVWSMGKVQDLPDIHLASNRIKWDMVDYMRTVCSSRTKERNRLAGHFYPNIVSLSSVLANDGNRLWHLQDQLEAKQDYCEVEHKDLFDTLLKGFDRTSKLIILLRYECGLGMRDIGKVIGVTEPRVSQLHFSILKQLRVKLIDMGLAERTRTSTFKRRRNTENQRLYNRCYWDQNRDHISVQRAIKRSQSKVAVA